MKIKGYNIKRLDYGTNITNTKDGDEIRTVILRGKVEPSDKPGFERSVSVSIPDEILDRAPKKIRNAIEVVESFYGEFLEQVIEIDLADAKDGGKKKTNKEIRANRKAKTKKAKAKTKKASGSARK